MNTYRVALLSGDGIGPIMVQEAEALLTVLGDLSGFHCICTHFPFGRAAFETLGSPLPEQTRQGILDADAALAAAVDAKGVAGPTPVGLLRKELGLFADIRPIKARPGRWSLRDDLDMVVVREITQGFLSDRNLYAGSGEWMSDPDTAFSLRVISYAASRRIAEYAFAYAEQHHRKRITALHKSSIFKQTCGTFLRACRDAAADHPTILYSEEVIDNTANGLIAHPETYDLLLTTNLFGDIISDEAAALVSSLAPSVNVGPSCHVYLPVTHAPAYEALQSDSFDPMPALLCLVMLLQELGEAEGAQRLERALSETLRLPGMSASAQLSHIYAALRPGGRGST